MSAKTKAAKQTRWEVISGRVRFDNTYRWTGRSGNRGLTKDFPDAESALEALAVNATLGFYRVQKVGDNKGKGYFEGNARQARARLLKKKEKLGALYVGKDGRLYATSTGRLVTEEQLKGLAAAAGFSTTEKVEVVKVRERRVKVEVPVVPDRVKDAIERMPPIVKSIVQEIYKDPDLNTGILVMVERASEFRSTEAAILSGVAMEPRARAFFSERLDQAWAKNAMPRNVCDEVVIGGGLHAAIYCAMRVSRGFAPPLVLEQNERAGGVFASSKRASFFLNSRNRPGSLSVPGERDGTLNYLPGAILQPSDIDNTEYITNEAMAWVIRLTLAMNAKVVTDAQVTNSYRGAYKRDKTGVYFNPQHAATMKGRASGRRFIFAQGLGRTKKLLDDRHVVSFTEFLARMDNPFPLRDMKRVAVIGNGDSAKTTIEALIGQGPQTGMSVASLDFPRRIDWYGPGSDMTCEMWLQQNRSRYAGIAGSLPRTDARDGDGRLFPRNKLSDSLSSGYNCALVGEIPYDMVIDCTGFTREADTGSEFTKVFNVGNRTVAFKDGFNNFQIGPSLNLVLSTPEAALLKGIAENSTSLFRYAGRTAQLAEVLA